MNTTPRCPALYRWLRTPRSVSLASLGRARTNRCTTVTAGRCAL